MADARKPAPPTRARQIAGPLKGYRLGAAVTFIRLDEETRNRIERAIDRQLDRPPEDDAPVIDGGGQR